MTNRVIATLLAVTSMIAGSAYAQERTSGKMKFLTQGKWMATLTTDHLGAFTAQMGGDANGTKPNVAVLYFKCGKGTRCRFEIKFIGRKPPSVCDPGERYALNYQVQGYAPRKAMATCDVEGTGLTLADTDAFGAAISGEIDVTFTFNIQGTQRVETFSLVGFNEIVDEAQKKIRPQ